MYVYTRTHGLIHASPARAQHQFTTMHVYRIHIYTNTHTHDRNHAFTARVQQHPEPCMYT